MLQPVTAERLLMTEVEDHQTAICHRNDQPNSRLVSTNNRQQRGEP